MEPDSSSQTALEEAARWSARLQAPDCTQQERDAFAEWRRNDANREAFRNAERLSTLVFRASTTDSRLRAMAEQALAAGPSAEQAPGRGKRTWWVPASLAAGIVAAVLVLGFGGLSDTGVDVVHYASAAAQRQIILPDGTSVHLDVRTEIDVQLGAGIRQINLHRGRALFDVAHDAERPFVVTAGDGRVTALGTAFQVYRRSSHEVIVTLTEGAVEVSSDTERGRARHQRLAPGEELRITHESDAWRKQRIDVAASTSWAEGRHVFRDSPLTEAVDEVNRYAPRRVVIADPSLRDLTVSGSFVTGDSASIVAAFAAVLPIRAAESGDEILLFRRR